MLVIPRHLCWLSAAVFFNLAIVNLAHSRKLPPGFLLGVSTASYQIEGAWNVSGKGMNTWDHLMLTNPNHTFDHKWGDIACDSYHNVERDVEMLQDLGVDVYRFSLSWSRLLPTGFDDVLNADGVRYYNTLIDTLIAKGITPMVTIFHWDLPQSLQDIGGWPNPDLADYYVDYANCVFRLFGDRVKLWITFNEPYQYCKQSYGIGNHAPAINRSGVADYKCGHTILRAHAKAYHLYKETYAAQNGKISITLDVQWYEPKNSCWPPDVHAAERRLEFELGWFAHPIYTPTGGYPPEMIKRVTQESQDQGLSRSRLPSFTREEITSLIGSSDFFALNHYTTFLVENLNNDFYWPIPSREHDMGVLETSDPTWIKSDVLGSFSIVPWGFRKLLNWIRTHYNNPPVYITENGFPDNGDLEDYDRLLYYSNLLEEMLNAIYKDKCNVIGYTAWSLMDNFEWRFGYTVKFGLYQVDFTDPARTTTPKLSAKYFKKLTKRRELPFVENRTSIEGPRFSEPENTIHLIQDYLWRNTSSALPTEQGTVCVGPTKNTIYHSIRFGPWPSIAPHPQSLSPPFSPQLRLTLHPTPAPPLWLDVPIPWQHGNPHPRPDTRTIPNGFAPRFNPFPAGEIKNVIFKVGVVKQSRFYTVIQNSICSL